MAEIRSNHLCRAARESQRARNLLAGKSWSVLKALTALRDHKPLVGRQQLCLASSPLPKGSPGLLPGKNGSFPTQRKSKKPPPSLPATSLPRGAGW